MIKIANLLDKLGHIEIATEIDEIIRYAATPIFWKCRGECKKEVASVEQPPDCCGRPMEPKDCAHCEKPLRSSLRTTDNQFKSCPMCSARSGYHVFYDKSNYTMSPSRARAGENTGFPTNCDGCNWNKDLHGKAKNLPPADIDCKLAVRGPERSGDPYAKKKNTPINPKSKENPAWMSFLKQHPGSIFEANAGAYKEYVSSAAARPEVGDMVNSPSMGEGMVVKVMNSNADELYKMRLALVFNKELIGQLKDL